MTADQDSSPTPWADAPPRVFSNVGVLLRPALWLDWLTVHPEPGRAELLATAYRCIVRLSSHTGWVEAHVLDRLGCDTKSDEQLLQLPEDQMRLCTSYFEWVESLLLELDLASDKRLIVPAAARFFAAADTDLDLCTNIMETGGFSPLEYLRLGEIAQAWQCAVRHLPGPRGERARRTQSENPFIDDRTPHLSPKRLDMLAHSDSRELLGSRVEERINEHLELCGLCAEAHKRRRSNASRRHLHLSYASV